MKCQPPVPISWSPQELQTGIYRRLLFSRRRGLSRGQTLPGLICVSNKLHVTAKSLADYRFVVQEAGDTENVPLFFPHAMFGGAHLRMIAHPTFPLRASGLLHLRNHVLQHRPFSASELWDMRCVLSRQRHVEKGLEFDFDSRVTIDGQVVWESISTYFKRGKGAHIDASHELEASPLAGLFAGIEATAVTKTTIGVPYNIGKRYAKVTGDYNPIHVSNLAAKLFGFKRAIAHGMWSVARTVHELPTIGGSIRHDVAFKGPMYVNSQAEIRCDDHGRFEIYCGTNTRPVIVGLYRQAAEGERLSAIA